MTPTEPIPVVSIMIPFYKGLDFLNLAIKSVLLQVDSNWTLTVVDDCGPDGNAAALVAAFKDPRISYERNDKNLGLAGNWNRCLSLAKSELVTLLHNDDELLPNYVGEMRALYTKYPSASILFCQATIVNGDGKSVFSFADFVKKFLIPKVEGTSPIVLQNEDGFTKIMRGNFIFCPTMCFNTKKLGSRTFDTELKFVVDLNFIAETLLNDQLIVGSRAIGYFYRRHETNTTVLLTVNNQRFQEEVWCHKKFAALALAKKWQRGAKVASRFAMVRANILFNIASDLASFRTEGLRDRLGLLISK